MNVPIGGPIGTPSSPRFNLMGIGARGGQPASASVPKGVPFHGGGQLSLFEGCQKRLTIPGAWVHGFMGILRRGKHKGALWVPVAQFSYNRAHLVSQDHDFRPVGFACWQLNIAGLPVDPLFF